MNTKIFGAFIFSFVILGLVYYINPYINFYNTEFIHPFFWALLPISILLLVISWFKKIDIRNIVTTIFVFGIIEFIVLFNIDTTCSPMICFSRNMVALWLSSLFSLIYFIYLLIADDRKYSK